MTDQPQSSILPPGFLFRYTLAVQPAPNVPGSGANRVPLGVEHRLPSLSEITGEPSWMALSVGWNHSGLGFVAEVQRPPNKFRARLIDPPLHFSFQWRLMFDLRDTRNIHRANRFCLHFALQVARGSNWDGRELRQLWIDRAREPAPRVDLPLIHHGIQESTEGYRVELWFPSQTLPGFDPSEHRRIGFSHDFEDERWGRQSLCLNPSFPTIYDPSLWQSLELQGDPGEGSAPRANPRSKGPNRTRDDSSHTSS